MYIHFTYMKTVNNTIWNSKLRAQNCNNIKNMNNLFTKRLLAVHCQLITVNVDTVNVISFAFTQLNTLYLQRHTKCVIYQIYVPFYWYFSFGLWRFLSSK